MKKIKMLFVILLCFLVNTNIKALSPNIVLQPNIYANKVQGALTYYGQLGYIYVNNKIAYCIEPYKLVGTNYIVNPAIANQFSQADLTYFALLSYYGYNSTNHNNVYYYMATQELIWRRITGQEVYWTTENLTKGTRINIDHYKNEIVTAVNNHNKTVSFGNQKIKGNFRDVVILEDHNNLLKYYQIDNKTPNQVWKQGNKLYIKIMSSKEQTVKLNRKFGDGSKNVFYSQTGNQSIASFSLNQTQTVSLNIQATNKYSMKIRINFKNINTKNDVNGIIKFKIKNLENNEYLHNGEIFQTNEIGKFDSDFYIEEGKYQIELVEVFPNYIIEENGTIFEIIEDPTMELIEINDYIDEAKGIIEINRYFDMTNLGKQKIEVPNAEYDVYAKSNIYDIEGNLIYEKDQWITKIATDKNGYTSTPLLPLGDYYIKETYIEDNIVKNEEIHTIELKYQNNQTKQVIQKLDIITEPYYFDWKLNVEENKINCINNRCKENHRQLEDIEYGIFAKEDIIVNEEIIYEKGELITDKKTDEKGEINQEIPLLKGNYEIKELTDMSQYEEKFENVEFSFDENKNSDIKLMKTIRKNTTLPILPNTSNKYFKHYIIGFLGIIISIIRIIYEKKKE